MSFEREVFPDAQAAAAACARHIAIQLQRALAARPQATLAVSGGHTPKLMFPSLTQLAVDWSRIHLFFVDERCVPPDDDASNYKLARENLLAHASIPDANVHRIAGEKEPGDAARGYSEAIQQFFRLAAGAMPQFDVVQCGMGPDGHTASLFPGDPLVSDRKGIAAAVYAPQFRQWRVTLLPGPLLAARHILYLVSGDDKAEMVRTVFHEAIDPRKHPAQLAFENPEGATWFIDQAAAKLLDP